MGIFDKILDAYDKGVEEGREYLHKVIEDGLVWNSQVKNFLPPHMTYDDLKSESMMALDKIALSDKTREKKISNMYATSKFVHVPQYFALNCSENGTVFVPDLCGVEDLAFEAPAVDEEEMLYESLYNRGLFTEEERDVMCLYANKINSPESIAEELGIDVSTVKNIRYRARKKIRFLDLDVGIFI